MEVPQISIICPVYNAEKYLSQCIESVLKQTLADYELLLIDDGSKDNSGIICDKYATRDSRIKVFHKENGGVASARNMGISVASGKWIAFVDSDDWLEDDYLSAMNLHAKGDTTMVVFCGLKKISKENIEFFDNPYSQTEYSKEQIDIFLSENNSFIKCDGSSYLKLFRKDVVEKFNIKFPEKISAYEDVLFSLTNALCAEKIAISEGASYNYRTGVSGSLSRTYHEPEQYLEVAKKALSLYADYCKDKNNGKMILNDAIISEWLKIASFCIPAIYKCEFSVQRRCRVLQSLNGLFSGYSWTQMNSLGLLMSLLIWVNYLMPARIADFFYKPLFILKKYCKFF